MNLWSLLAASIPVILFRFVPLSASLSCIQCVQSGQADNYTRTKLCYAGILPATPCPHPNHTHCITTFYRTFNDYGSPGEITTIVTWRECGFESDVQECTVHLVPEKRQPKSALTRNSKDSADYESNRGFERIEVCALGCTANGCLINSALMPTSSRISELWWASIFVILLWCF